jgi:hypothetical protein
MGKRERLSHERWCELIERQAAGNQTVATFCQEQGITEHSFYRHKRRMREPGGGGFREIALTGGTGIRIVVDSDSSHIEVERGFDAVLLRDVMAALR